MFRLSPFEWFQKLSGVPAMYELYPTEPTLGRIFSEIGWKGVLAIQLHEVGKFLETVFRPTAWVGGLLSPLAFGIPSILVHVRDQPRFAGLCGLSLLGVVAFVCGLYHMEPRYFTMLVPLLSASLAGAIAAGVRGVGQGWVAHSLRAASLGVGALVLWVPVSTLPKLAAKEVFAPMHHALLCPEAVAWMAREIPVGEPILSFNPWWVNWMTDRPGIMLPTGGRAQVTKVARHYAARWLFLHPMPEFGPIQGRVEEMLQRPDRDLRAELVFDGGPCDVFLLHWRDPTARRAAPSTPRAGVR
jgi:hypothetical protein